MFIILFPWVVFPLPGELTIRNTTAGRVQGYIAMEQNGKGCERRRMKKVPFCQLRSMALFQQGADSTFT
jgi:hypothetical protein